MFWYAGSSKAGTRACWHSSQSGVLVCFVGWDPFLGYQSSVALLDCPTTRAPMPLQALYIEKRKRGAQEVKRRGKPTRSRLPSPVLCQIQEVMFQRVPVPKSTPVPHRQLTYILQL